MKKIFIFILVVVVVVYGVMYLSKSKKVMVNTSAQVETINTQTTTTAENTMTTKGQTYNISIENFAFDQKTITINKGDTIVWKNIDKAPHQVEGATFKDLKGPIMGYGLTYSFTFNDAGTYDYFCTIHPMMKATVIVK